MEDDTKESLPHFTSHASRTLPAMAVIELSTILKSEYALAVSIARAVITRMAVQAVVGDEDEGATE